MVDMDVSRYLIHRALLSRLGEQITLTAPYFTREIFSHLPKGLFEIYILEKEIWMVYDHEHQVRLPKPRRIRHGNLFGTSGEGVQ